MLSLFGRKMRTGLDVHHMSVSIAALVSGMVTSARFDEPDAGYEVVTAGRRGATTRWHLAARASWAIFDSFTEEK
jgi:hypothetical protein